MDKMANLLSEGFPGKSTANISIKAYSHLLTSWVGCLLTNTWVGISISTARACRGVANLKIYLCDSQGQMRRDNRPGLLQLLPFTLPMLFDAASISELFVRSEILAHTLFTVSSGQLPTQLILYYSSNRQVNQ